MADSASRPRSALCLVRDPTFGLFFVGRLLAGTGVWVHSVVAAIVAYELSRSALVVGAVSAAQFLPQMLFAPLSGARVDRGNRTQQIIVGWLISALGSASLCLIIAVPDISGMMGAPVLVVASLLTGIGFVVSGPAMQAAVPSLVQPNELSTAMALNSIPLMISRAGGPIVGAFIATTAGPGFGFGLAATLSTVFAALVWGIRMPPQDMPEIGADTSVRAAFRLLRTDRTLMFLLVGVSAVGVAGDPAITLAPSLSDELLGTAELVGPIAGAFGAGTGLGFFVLATLRGLATAAPVAPLGMTSIAAGMLLAGLADGVAQTLVGFVIAGLGTAIALTSLTTQLQERVGESIRGRIMALWMIGFLGSRPVAALINGQVSDLYSPDLALVITAGIVLLGTCVCWSPMSGGKP